MTDRFLITIMLPDNLAREISEIQEQFRTPSWPKNIEPHITLFPPFTHRVNKSELETLLTSIATRFQPFPIHIAGIGTFRPKTSVIFAKVEKDEELARLQQTINSALKPIANRPGSNPTAFHPHVTLSNRLKPDAFDRQLKQIRSIKIDHHFICDRFSLMQLDKGKWQIVRDFVFRSIKSLPA